MHQIVPLQNQNQIVRLPYRLSFLLNLRISEKAVVDEEEIKQLVKVANMSIAIYTWSMNVHLVIVL